MIVHPAAAAKTVPANEKLQNSDGPGPVRVTPLLIGP